MIRLLAHMIDTNGVYHVIGALVNSAAGAGSRGSNGTLGGVIWLLTEPYGIPKQVANRRKAIRYRRAISAPRKPDVELALQFAQVELRRRNSTREIPMAFFVVNCELRRKDEFDYQELWDEFEPLDAVKYQKSDNFLSVSNTADEIRDHFKWFVHEDDPLMVISHRIREKTKIHEVAQRNERVDR